jgi:DNA-binding transcriptional ArsR family regulator
MTRLGDDLAAIDRLIHEPARLVIMTALSSCMYADFLFLQRLTGLTAGNLSSHLSKLEEAGLVRQDKQIVGKRPRTQVGLSDKGRGAIQAHWQQLEQLRQRAAQEGKSIDTPDGES